MEVADKIGSRYSSRARSSHYSILRKRKIGVISVQILFLGIIFHPAK